MILFNLFAAACGTGSFFSFPAWHSYLPSSGVDSFGQCQFTFDYTNPLTFGLIGLAILDILLRIGGMVAFGLLVWGGIQFLTSQGNPEGVKKAIATVTNALVGLAITLSAAGVIAFIAGKF